MAQRLVGSDVLRAGQRNRAHNERDQEPHNLLTIRSIYLILLPAASRRLVHYTPALSNNTIYRVRQNKVVPPPEKSVGGHVKRSITRSFFNRITFHLTVRCRTFQKQNLLKFKLKFQTDAEKTAKNFRGLLYFAASCRNMTQ